MQDLRRRKEITIFLRYEQLKIVKFHCFCIIKLCSCSFNFFFIGTVLLEASLIFKFDLISKSKLFSRILHIRLKISWQQLDFKEKAQG